ncbi:PREDICTED: uncharacterized protein LOC103771425 [Merops nubicus]|uniref:uncharacterized protein LOC103771425 n=1 Tax=Merops nubicus TaxID=57421 RepID=UPI0004F09554|nr:PREDICTED: uncharacterized protein LOC103771425 [Merops nubicus]
MMILGQHQLLDLVQALEAAVMEVAVNQVAVTLSLVQSQAVNQNQSLTHLERRTKFKLNHHQKLMDLSFGSPVQVYLLCRDQQYSKSNSRRQLHQTVVQKRIH